MWQHTSIGSVRTVPECLRCFSLLLDHRAAGTVEEADFHYQYSSQQTRSLCRRSSFVYLHCYHQTNPLNHPCCSLGQRRHWRREMQLAVVCRQGPLDRKTPMGAVSVRKLVPRHQNQCPANSLHCFVGLFHLLRLQLQSDSHELPAFVPCKFNISRMQYKI